jgi:hypothetical protein
VRSDVLLALVLTALALAGAAPARAQAEPVGVRDAVQEAIGTLVTLSTGPGLSSATYRIDREPLELTKFELVAPLPIGLGRPLDAPDPAARPAWVVEARGPGPFLLEPVVSARFGRLETEDLVRGPTTLPGARLELESVGAGAGLGVRVQPWTWLRLEPRVDLVQCRTTALPGGPPAARATLRVVADDVVHWRAETLSILAQLSVSSRIPLGPLRLSPRGTLACVRVESYSSSSPLQEGGSWSSLASVGLDVDLPVLGLALGGCPLRLQAGATCTLYGGVAGAAFDRRAIFELPAALYFDTAGRVAYLTRLGVNGEYARGRDIEGWAVGVDFDFDF